MGPARGTTEEEDGVEDKDTGDTDEEEEGMMSVVRAGFTTAGVREDEAGMTMEEEERPTRETTTSKRIRFVRHL